MKDNKFKNQMEEHVSLTIHWTVSVKKNASFYYEVLQRVLLLNYQKKKNARVSETFFQTHSVHVLKGNEKKNAGLNETFCQTHGVHVLNGIEKTV